MSKSKEPSIHIFVEQEVLATQQRLLEVMADHVGLERFFKAKFSIVQQANAGEIKGGKGCIRRVSSGKSQFNEEIIAASSNGISYRIIGLGPVTDHQGDIVFKNDDHLTIIQYHIKFNGPKWVPDFLVKYIVTKDMTIGLIKLADYFKSKH